MALHTSLMRHLDNNDDLRTFNSSEINRDLINKMKSEGFIFFQSIGENGKFWQFAKVAAIVTYLTDAKLHTTEYNK